MFHVDFSECQGEPRTNNFYNSAFPGQIAAFQGNQLTLQASRVHSLGKIQRIILAKKYNYDVYIKVFLHLLTECNEKFSISLSLIRWQG